MKKLRVLGMLICLFVVNQAIAQTTFDCDGIASAITETQSFCDSTEQLAYAQADARLVDLQSMNPGLTIFYAVVNVVSDPGIFCVIVQYFRCLEGAAYPGIDHYKTASPIKSTITPMLDLGYQITQIDNFKDGRTRVEMTDALGKVFIITVDKTGALAGITQEVE